MTSTSRQGSATGLVIALAIIFVPLNVQACGFAIEREQITIFGRLDSRPGLVPQEAVVKVGDTISVLGPGNTKVLAVDIDDQPSSLLVPITPDQYKSLIKQGGTTNPPRIHAFNAPKTAEWFHYGVTSTGIGYLKLASGSERGIVRVEIRDRPAVIRGANLNWSDDRQSESIDLTQFDTLTLDLPGELGHGWQVRMRQGKATLKSAAMADIGVESKQSRVLLRIEASPNGPEDELVVTYAGIKSYRFSVRPKAIPKC